MKDVGVVERDEMRVYARLFIVMGDVGQVSRDQCRVIMDGRAIVKDVGVMLVDVDGVGVYVRAVRVH